MNGLAGKTILLTRSREMNKTDSLLVRKRGATVMTLPGITIGEPDSWGSCDAAIVRLRSYDSVVFTSANAVKAFLGRIDAINPDARIVLAGKQLIAIGGKTQAALNRSGLATAATLEAGTAAELARAMGDVTGRMILFPKSDIARDVLPSVLRARDAVVDDIVVYKTLPPPAGDLNRIRNAIRTGGVNAVLFFSPSALWNIVQMIGIRAISELTVAVIGSTTASAARQAGLEVDVVAPKPSLESLLDSLEQYYKNKQTMPS
jgi:uroporphyrinogen-III synthase